MKSSQGSKCQLIIYLFFFFIISCNSNTDEFTQKNYKSSFEDFFHIVDSTEIIGTKERPLYSLTRLTQIDSTYYILDNSNHQILSYKNNGQFLDRWGLQGRGPAEFLDPKWIGTTPDSSIFIVDGGGNLRVQTFDLGGELVNTFDLKSSGPFEQSYMIVYEGDTLFATTTISNCNSKITNGCIIQLQDLSGKIVNEFATIEEVAPYSKGLPFLSAYSEQLNRFFVTHVNGTNVSIYNISGDKLDEFSLEKSPHVKFLDTSTLPDDVYEQAREMRERSYVIIGELFSSRTNLIVQYFNGGKNLFDYMSESFLDVFTDQGELLHSGIATTIRLLHVEQDNFYFMKEVKDTSEFPYGKYVIYHYTVREF